jgi:hypothetical protein
MILALMSTGHFEWRALGKSEADARRLIVEGFTRHLASFDSSPEQWAEEVDHGRYVGKPFAASLEDWYGINTMAIAVGTCMRDWDVV